jgi:hypothetical protein
MEKDPFWSQVKKTDYCWIWEGPKFGPSGFGIYRNNGKGKMAHRFAYEQETGEVLNGKITLRQTCERRDCVRPDHQEKLPT